jgi:hypothetical protein
VNPLTDEDHCGTCDNTCGFMCLMGECV